MEFAPTPGGQLAYSRDLFAVPVAATVNYTTKNLPEGERLAPAAR